MPTNASAAVASAPASASATQSRLHDVAQQDGAGQRARRGAGGHRRRGAGGAERIDGGERHDREDGRARRRGREGHRGRSRSVAVWPTSALIGAIGIIARPMTTATSAGRYSSPMIGTSTNGSTTAMRHGAGGHDEHSRRARAGGRGPPRRQVGRRLGREPGQLERERLTDGVHPAERDAGGEADVADLGGRGMQPCDGDDASARHAERRNPLSAWIAAKRPTPSGSRSAGRTRRRTGATTPRATTAATPAATATAAAAPHCAEGRHQAERGHDEDRGLDRQAVAPQRGAPETEARPAPAGWRCCRGRWRAAAGRRGPPARGPAPRSRSRSRRRRPRPGAARAIAAMRVTSSRATAARSAPRWTGTKRDSVTGPPNDIEAPAIWTTATARASRPKSVRAERARQHGDEEASAPAPRRACPPARRRPGCGRARRCGRRAWPPRPSSRALPDGAGPRRSAPTRRRSGGARRGARPRRRRPPGRAGAGAGGRGRGSRPPPRRARRRRPAGRRASRPNAIASDASALTRWRAPRLSAPDASRRRSISRTQGTPRWRRSVRTMLRRRPALEVGSGDGRVEADARPGVGQPHPQLDVLDVVEARDRRRSRRRRGRPRGARRRGRSRRWWPPPPPGGGRGGAGGCGSARPSRGPTGAAS